MNNNTATQGKDIFDQRLNTTYLHNFYDGDIACAKEMFEIFIEHSLPEVENLRPLIESENWEAARRQAHKLKPAFPLVGLTQLQEKMLVIQKISSNEPDKERLLKLMNQVEAILEEYIPIVKQQLLRFDVS